MKKVESARESEKRNYIIFKITILIILFISVFLMAYMFGLKIVRDSKNSGKAEESINTLLERAKPKQ